MRDVLVVGGIFREIIRRPGDEEPEIRLAGSALTAAVAASRFGASVSIASFVGSEDADAAHSLLEHASVDTHLIVLDGASGTFAYAGDAEADNPQPLYRPAETCPTALPALPKARVLLAFGVPDFDPVRDLEVQASARTARTFIWDRQGWLSRTRDARAATALEVADRVLLANAAEAIDEGVLDRDTGEVRLPAGFNRVVVKDGHRGALVVDELEGERRSLVPAYPVRPLSTVGSGDLFGGVVAALLALREDLVTAATQAAAATSIVLASGDTFAPPDLQAFTQRFLAGNEGRVDWRWPLPD
jgi:sugar/nucleoside kinase (ribokinase family)